MLHYWHRGWWAKSAFSQWLLQLGKRNRIHRDTKSFDTMEQYQQGRHDMKDGLTGEGEGRSIKGMSGKRHIRSNQKATCIDVSRIYGWSAKGQWWKGPVVRFPFKANLSMVSLRTVSYCKEKRTSRELPITHMSSLLVMTLIQAWQPMVAIFNIRLY